MYKLTRTQFEDIKTDIISLGIKIVTIIIFVLFFFIGFTIIVSVMIRDNTIAARRRAKYYKLKEIRRNRHAKLK